MIYYRYIGLEGDTLWIDTDSTDLKLMTCSRDSDDLTYLSFNQEQAMQIIEQLQKFINKGDRK